MRSLLVTLQRLRVLFGAERRWRWVLLVALALLVTSFEVVGAALVFALLGFLTGDGAGASLPVVGDLEDLLPAVGETQLIVGVSAGVAAFFLLRFLVAIGRAYVQHRLVANAGALLADQVLRVYLSQPYLEHTRRSSSTLIRNVYDATQRVVQQALRPLVQVVAEAMVVVGLTAVLVVTSPTATLLAAIVLGPTVWLLQRVIQPRLRRLGEQTQAARSGALETVQQALSGIRDIKLLRREPAFAQRHLRSRLQLARASYLARTLSEMPRAMIETALVLTIAAVLIVSVLLDTGVQQIVPTLGLFAYVGLRLQPSLQKIVQGLNELQFASAMIDDLVEDLQGTDRQPLGPGDADIVTGPRFRDRIAIEDVSFSYTPDGNWALHEVNLEIPHGTFLGICGPTGGGKSTLVDLLIGLLPPTDGRISVDGVELDIEPAWWWQQLGVVSQQVFLTDESVRANIALGTPEDEIDDARLADAVHRAQLDDVVAVLPHGLDTRVGERGIQLSGGQRQRVAIARALYQHPEVLVFDEGTSALDVATETELVDAITTAQRDRTLIAVAHRIATLRDADRILVVASGRIVEDGAYDELLERSGLFRSLVR